MEQPNIFNIPGLGFAKPNEKLPPISTEAAPVEAAPGKAVPAEAVPVDAVPVDAVPVDAVPVDAVPVDAVPVDPIPVEAAPVKAAPAEAVPAETAQAVTPASDLTSRSRPHEKQPEASVDVASKQLDLDQSADIKELEATSQRDAASAVAPTAVPEDAVPSTRSPDNAESPPSLTRALELAIGLVPMDEDVAQGNEDQSGGLAEGGDRGQEEDQHSEWEADSSPYESASSESSDSASSDSESEEGEVYDVSMSIDETVRMLMMEGSDDEGEKQGAGRGQVRTKNEVEEEIFPKPNVTITPEMKILELGVVQHIIENTIVIEGSTTGEFQVLDAGSVVCKPDRTVVAVIGETLGQVQNPRYALKFPGAESIQELGLEVGSTLYYAAEFAKYVFTAAIKAAKGSDASNLHDEEVAEHERDYSNDEEEHRAKRPDRSRPKRRRGRDDGHHPRSPPQGRNGRKQDDAGLDYGDDDNDDDDGPYRPLARPSDFGSRSGFMAHQTEPPPLNTREGRRNNRGRGQRDRGGPRRGGGRGARNGGHGGYGHRNDGHGGSNDNSNNSNGNSGGGHRQSGGRRDDGRDRDFDREGSPRGPRMAGRHGGTTGASEAGPSRSEMSPQAQYPQVQYPGQFSAPQFNYQPPTWQQQGPATGPPGGFPMPQMPLPVVAGQQAPQAPQVPVPAQGPGTFFNPTFLTVMAQLQNAQRAQSFDGNAALYQPQQQQQQPPNMGQQQPAPALYLPANQQGQPQQPQQSWMSFHNAPNNGSVP